MVALIGSIGLSASIELHGNFFGDWLGRLAGTSISGDGVDSFVHSSSDVFDSVSVDDSEVDDVAGE